MTSEIQVSDDILGRALGASLSGVDNLHVVYLPEGVPSSTAAALVTEANRVRAKNLPFALLVADEDSECPEEYRVWPAANVIRYRQGDRLVVVLGRHTDLQSIETSFGELLGLAYPQDHAGPVELSVVATAALSVILSNSESLSQVSSYATARLAACFSQLSEIHASTGSGEKAWNAQWFRHVSVGLSRLAFVLKWKSESEPQLDLDEFFRRYLFASFSLPRPDDSHLLRTSGVGRAAALALSEYWADRARIETSVAQLQHHPDTKGGGPHALGNVDWSRFDSDLALEGSQAVALMLTHSSTIATVEAFAQLTPEQFLNPTATAKGSRTLVVEGPNGEDLSVSQTREAGPFLITGEVTQGELISEPIRISIPILSSSLDENAVNLSGLRLKISPAAISWTGNARLGPQGQLWLDGNLIRKIGSKAKSFVSATLSLVVPPNDSMSGAILDKATCTVHLVPEGRTALLAYRQSSGGSVGKPMSIGQDYLSSEQNSSDSTGLDIPFTATYPDSESTYRFVFVTGDSARAALHNGQGMELFKGRDGLYFDACKPGGIDVFEDQNSVFELRSPAPTTDVQSPIVAALTKQAVSQDGPNEATADSFRGLYEAQIAANINSSNWAYSLGHSAVLVDKEEIPFSDLDDDLNSSGILMHPATRKLWSILSDEKVPVSLLNSAEADDFRDAFAGLGVSAAMTRAGTESSDILDWPSRTSWRHLWLGDAGPLNRYLDTYSALIVKAREIGDPLGVFWASYPFCVSLWTSDGSLEASAVLLSPLHPIRLAWLASVEATLWESNQPLGLAGAIEGWNLPVFGPRQSSAGRMLSIPMDSGVGQLFLGWSMLVGASIEGEKPLAAPSRIGRYAAPGTAASGLNATAATSALRSYRRMYPHVSTLTVDLAAESRTSRLAEVDYAVLRQLKSWSEERTGQFRGGARVLDSLRRGGEVPEAAVAELARSNSTLPVLWSRYEPDSTRTETCNVRLLQDAGVRIAVAASLESNRGVLGQVPLRRFEAIVAPAIGANVARSRPGLSNASAEGSSFARALSQLEGAALSPEIRSKLHHAALIDKNADWTVAGESLVSPAAMAALVGAGSQMLWEWRPPFLEPEAGVPTLERRPFVSIARVPLGFKERLKKLLSKVTKAEPSEGEVAELLGRLGARGVGLSSLLSMGGTQSAGALGFYLGFTLADQSSLDSTADRFALPIDACDTFLKALAGTEKHAEATQRADLLILSLDDIGLTLVPVEIKFYGMDAAQPGGTLPSPDDSAIRPALQQLDSTMQLLASVQSKQGELLENGNDHQTALWRNALTTLVEAGVRLKPAGSKVSGKLTARLQGVLDGTIPVRVGKPIVTFFQHEAVSKTGELFSADIVESQFAKSAGPELSRTGFGALVANSSHAFAFCEAPSSPLMIEWKKVLDWAAAAGPEDPEITTRRKNDVESRSEYSPDSDLRRQPPVHPSMEDEDSTVARESRAELAHVADDSHTSLADPVNIPAVLNEQDALSIPVSGEGLKFDVGRLSGTLADSHASFWPGNTALNQMNVGVVGDLGTGKTQLLLALVAQLRDRAKASQPNPLSFLVFDYKRDFQNPEFLERVGGRLLSPNRIPLNIFSLPSKYTPIAAFQKANAFCDILAKIYAGIGPVQKGNLRTTITDLYKELGGEPPTLSEVYDRYLEVAKVDAVSSILQSFVIGEVFSDDRNELVSFDELIDDTVLVVALNEFGPDQDSKNALVALFLNLYYDYMLKSQKWPFVGADPQTRQLNSFILVDEASNIMSYKFDILMDLLLQGREFGFGTILASQYLSHFKPSGGGPNYAQPLLTWFIHKVPTVSAKDLDQLGIQGVSAEAASRISNLNVHEAFYSSLGFPGRFIEGKPYYKLEK